MLYSFFLNLQKMLGVALPFGFATPTFIIEPITNSSYFRLTNKRAGVTAPALGALHMMLQFLYKARGTLLAVFSPATLYL